MGDKRAKIVEKMLRSPRNVAFSDLVWLCDNDFGEGRQRGSHRVWKTGNPVNPVITLQSDGKHAKAYQVAQVLKIVAK